jgi:arylsulfatase A-like enzyme
MNKAVREALFSLPVFMVCFFCAIVPESHAVTLDSVFRDLDFSLQGIGDFIVEKDTRRESGNAGARTVIARKDEVVARLEIIRDTGEDEARTYVQEQNYVLESLFKRLPNPYPGMITNAIECPDSFKPEIVDTQVQGSPVSVYVLNSTPRFTYGTCVDELIRYRGVRTFVYAAGKKTLFRIELFYPKQSFDKELALRVIRSFTPLENSRSLTGQNEKPRPKGRGLTGFAVGKSVQNGGKDYRGYNLVIIALEPLGANHLKAYGYSRDTAPELERFAREGVLFRNAVSPSSWTLPVFMSWFTGQYPSRHKIVNKYSEFSSNTQVLANLQRLSPGTVTLAQILKENGYATAGFTGGAGLEGAFGFSQGFDVYYDKTTFGGFDLVFAMALQWLKEHRREKFFLFVQGFDVHGKHRPGTETKGKFADPSYRGRYRGTPEEYWELRNQSLDGTLPSLNEEDIRFWRDWYDGRIWEADKKIAGFLKEIRDLKLMDRTLVVISSGSGNEFFEHGGFDHGYSLYEELIRVPLVMHIPGVSGNIVEEQVRTLDIAPTVLELLGIERDRKAREQMQGVSLVPCMQGQRMNLDAFSETDYLLHTFKRSLRTSDGWKLIYTAETGNKELYDLSRDPEEKTDLADAQPGKAYEMEQELRKNYMTAGSR